MLVDLNENIGNKACRYIRGFTEKENGGPVIILSLGDVSRLVSQEENLLLEDTEKREN